MLFFRSGGELFAISIEAVEEVVVSGDMAPVPLAPAGVVGIVNHRGRIFTVLDFASLAGLEGGGAGPTSVFLHRRDMAVGFTVASIEGIEGVPPGLLDGAHSAAVQRRPFLKGLLDYEDRLANIVDPEELAGYIARLPEGGAGEAAAEGERRGWNGR